MLTRYRPFFDVTRFNRDIDHFFGTRRGNGALHHFAPAVDIEETEEAILLSADLPGVDEKDIEITVNQGTLILSGKREDKVDEKTDHGVYQERRYGSFFRRFRLGSKVDPDAIVAAYKNGVLTVTLPKKEEEKPKQIPVATT